MREKIQMMIWWQHSEEPWKVWEYCDIIATGNIRVCVLVVMSLDIIRENFVNELDSVVILL